MILVKSSFQSVLFLIIAISVQPNLKLALCQVRHWCRLRTDGLPWLHQRGDLFSFLESASKHTQRHKVEFLVRKINNNSDFCNFTKLITIRNHLIIVQLVEFFKSVIFDFFWNFGDFHLATLSGRFLEIFLKYRVFIWQLNLGDFLEFLEVRTFCLATQFGRFLEFFGTPINYHLATPLEFISDFGLLRLSNH